MIRRVSLCIGICALLVHVCSCSKSSPPAKSEALPARRDFNVLLITLDTLRADYLSCYGGKKVATPNLDALAARGVRFDQAIVQVPLTAPSHASILTGTYPPVHKLYDMGGFVLDKTVPTLATLCSQAGFQTGAILGAAVLSHHYGLNRGFTTYNDDMKPQKGSELKSVVGEVRGEVVTRRATEWLSKVDPGKNFFLWVHYYDPHFPYDPPEEYRKGYAQDLYGGEVAYTDSEIGKLLAALQERQLGNRTLVIVVADHGESLGEHGEYTHGVFLYDSTMRVPLIVRGPGVPAGKVVPQQVRSIDIMPTAAEFLGLSAGEKAQGTSLLPAILEGKGTHTNYCFLQTLYPKTHMGWSELRAMRTDEWKLIVAPKPELYRIREDNMEIRNLIERQPVEADHLQKKVWEVAGPPEKQADIKPQPIDDERLRELNALGYVSSGTRKIQIDMSGPDPKDRIEVLEGLEHATDAMNHDRFREAVSILRKLLRLDPTNPLLYKDLGHSLQRLGQYEQAEKVYLDAIRSRVDSDQTHAELGNIYVRRGDLPRAAEAMDRGAKLSLTNLGNLLNLATTYLHLGRQEDTERTLRAILTQNSRHAGAHNLFGILEIQRGKAAEARTHFERAVEFNPELTEAYMNLGLLAQNAGEPKRAVMYYKKFLKLAKPDKYGEIIPKVKAAISDLESNQ